MRACVRACFFFSSVSKQINLPEKAYNAESIGDGRKKHTHKARLLSLQLTVTIMSPFWCVCFFFFVCVCVFVCLHGVCGAFCVYVCVVVVVVVFGGQLVTGVKAAELCDSSQDRPMDHVTNLVHWSECFMLVQTLLIILVPVSALQEKMKA